MASGEVPRYSRFKANPEKGNFWAGSKKESFRISKESSPEEVQVWTDFVAYHFDKPEERFGIDELISGLLLEAITVDELKPEVLEMYYNTTDANKIKENILEVRSVILSVYSASV